MALASWLQTLRKEQIIRRVNADPRTRGDFLLGVHRDRVFSDVIEGGQADFDADWSDGTSTLKPHDRALLYAYFNQNGHLAELCAAMTMLTRNGSLKNPVVIDLGCGPFTGGLAVADALGPGSRFTYIGLDRAKSMRDLGEVLARAPEATDYMRSVERHWTATLADHRWNEAPSWRPVLVLVSYLLASRTVDSVAIIDEVMAFVERHLGRGPVVLLYTNSTKLTPNQQFPAFRSTLTKHAFEVVADDLGSISIDSRDRGLRYALFRRVARTTLDLGGD